MKHLLVLLTILSILVMTACHQSTNNSQPSAQPSATELTSTTPSSVYPIFVDYENLEDYNRFIDTTSELPENFITAEDLHSFGTFTYFTCFDLPSFSSYSYNFCLENGFTFLITVVHENSQDKNAEDDYESTWKRLEDPKFTSDMRYLTEKNTGKAIVGDITYMYNLGKLSSLSWRIDDTMISIFFTVSNIDEFPTESTDSILCCLLSASESISASAIKDINNVITENRK